MTIESSTLRPGLLVSLKTTIEGNVKYARHVLENETTDTGAEKARWETLRTITDPVEHRKAGEVRSKVRSLITGVCARSAFGLLCPESWQDKLEGVVADARKLADEFNRDARQSQINVYVMTGRIAPDDVEAVRAINSEVRDLLEDMKTGVQNLDVRAIRDAANKARSIGAMLSPGAAARIQDAITAARGAARKIVKAGEQAAVTIDQQALREITTARTAFLDLDTDAAVEITAPVETRTLDLAPDVADGGDMVKVAAPAFQVEF